MAQTKYRTVRLLGSGTFGAVFESIEATEFHQQPESYNPCVMKKQVYAFERDLDELHVVHDETIHSLSEQRNEQTLDEGDQDQTEPCTPRVRSGGGMGQSAGHIQQSIVIPGDLPAHRELSVSVALGHALDMESILREEREIRQLEGQASTNRQTAQANSGKPRDQALAPQIGLPKAGTATPLIPTVVNAVLAYQAGPDLENPGRVLSVEASIADRAGSLELCTVSERFGQDLQSALTTSPHLFTPAIQAEVARQMLGAVASLHGAGLMHRDLKPANLLIDFVPLPAPGPTEGSLAKIAWPLVRLCDMGSARPVDPAEVANPYVMSRYYRAPELLCCSSRYDESVDTWALALSLIELYAVPACVTAPDGGTAQWVTADRYPQGRAYGLEKAEREFDAALKRLPLKADTGMHDEADPQYLHAKAKYQAAVRKVRREQAANVFLFPGMHSDAGQLLHIMNVLGVPTSDDIRGMKLPVWSEHALSWTASEVQAIAARMNRYKRQVAAGLGAQLQKGPTTGQTVMILPLSRTLRVRFRGVTPEVRSAANQVLLLDSAYYTVEELQEELKVQEAEHSKDTSTGRAERAEYAARAERIQWLKYLLTNEEGREVLATLNEPWPDHDTHPGTDCAGKAGLQPAQWPEKSSSVSAVPSLDLVWLLPRMGVPKPLAHIIKAMLQWDPAKRMTPAQALESVHMEELMVEALQSLVPIRDGEAGAAGRAARAHVPVQAQAARDASLAEADGQHEGAPHAGQKRKHAQLLMQEEDSDEGGEEEEAQEQQRAAAQPKGTLPSPIAAEEDL